MKQKLIQLGLISLVILSLSACGKKKKKDEKLEKHTIAKLHDPYLQQYSKDGSGIYHQVRRGETLNLLAKTYHISAPELAKANGIRNMDVLEQGFLLYVPGVRTTSHPRISKASLDEFSRRENTLPTRGRKGPLTAEKRFKWPANGLILAGFGDPTDGFKKLKGIKIKTPFGTRIKAVKSGKVSWVSSGMSGYGRVVALQHSDGYTSIYGFCSEILVTQGTWIKQGDVIALSGKSGVTTVPSLYLQIAKGRKDLDPLKFLN